MNMAWFKQILRRAEVDHAVFFGVALKAWGLLSGPITALLVIAKFTPELQGYYYTFWSVVGLQIFVELGFSTVITQFASHEWSKLKFDKNKKIIGDEFALSRLISLAHIAKKWYLTAAVIAVTVFAIGGYMFFVRSDNPNISWKAPWLSLCFLTGVNICLIPIWAILEGCNQVKQVYNYRFVQGVCSVLCVWFAIILGAKLWTASVYSSIVIMTACVFLKWKYLTFLKTLFFSKLGKGRVEWRSEMLSMQWRLAVASASSYFAFYLFVPVLFKFHGAVVAGQFGMTWALVGAMQAISSSWLYPKIPTWAILIAKREYKLLDNLFWRITRIVFVVSVLLAVAIWCFVYALYWFKYSLAYRILSPFPTGLLLAGHLMMVLSMPFSYYLRAHKKEPLMPVSVVYSVLVGLSTLVLGKYYSATGMAIGYFVINLILVPFVVVYWCRLREIWHGYVENANDFKDNIPRTITSLQTS